MNLLTLQFGWVVTTFMTSWNLKGCCVGLCAAHVKDLQRHSGFLALQVSSLRELHQQAQKYNSQLQEYNTKLQQDLALSNDNLQKLQVKPAGPQLAPSLWIPPDLCSVNACCFDPTTFCGINVLMLSLIVEMGSDKHRTQCCV